MIAIEERQASEGLWIFEKGYSLRFNCFEGRAFVMSAPGNNEAFDYESLIEGSRKIPDEEFVSHRRVVEIAKNHLVQSCIKKCPKIDEKHAHFLSSSRHLGWWRVYEWESHVSPGPYAEVADKLLHCSFFLVDRIKESELVALFDHYALLRDLNNQVAAGKSDANGRRTARL